MIIKGNVVLTCPQTGKEVRLYKDCMKSKDPKNTCQHFKHFGVAGHQIVIACAFDEYERYQRDVTQK